MLSSGLSVEGIGHGLPLHSAGSFPSFLAASHHHHMTFMDPFLKSDLRTTTTVPPVPEFIRPLPKPMGLSTKHFSSNALASSGGGGNSRAVSRSLLGKYHDPGGQGGPVNLSQSSSSSTSSSKETPSSSPSHSPANGGGGGSESSQSQQTNFRNMYSAPGLFVPPPPPTISMYPPMQGPFASLYPGHYIPLQLSREQATSLAPSSATISPLEQFPNSQPSPNSPATAYSPPTLSSPSPKSLPPPAPSSKELKRPPSFKVSSINPSGKEGSLKHRILTSRAPKRSHAVSEAAVSTPVAVPSSIAATPVAVPHSAGAPTTATLPFGQNNNHAAPNFSRGSLIQLANGELKRVEDMKAEDFINSAKNSSELCLDPSTVVRIDESTLSRKGTTILTLSHGDSRTEVDLESGMEQPYFVMGHGWASCCPDVTYMKYGLECHKLQVGDVCISLTPRQSDPTKRKRSPCQSVKSDPGAGAAVSPLLSLAKQKKDLGGASASSKEIIASKKRRWSAPDQFCDEEGVVPSTRPPSHDSGLFQAKAPLHNSKLSSK